jgi:GntR family transcriptional repressor for pyruvate dehydrogenase complex
MFAGDDSFDRNRVSVADRVLRDLESSILSGRLEHGAKLPSEKELAVHYGVSGPTVREAIRALSAMGLIEVRHGSGMTVVADSSLLMASAMSSVVELDNVDLPSILDLSETLNLRAVELAIASAASAEIEEVGRAAAHFSDSMSEDEFAQSLESFLKGLIALSHNKLLEATASFVIETHIGLARQAARDRPLEWAQTADELRGERVAIIDAIRARDQDQAAEAVRTYMNRARRLARGNASAA